MQIRKIRKYDHTKIYIFSTCPKNGWSRHLFKIVCGTNMRSLIDFIRVFKSENGKSFKSSWTFTLIESQWISELNFWWHSATWSRTTYNAHDQNIWTFEINGIVWSNNRFLFHVVMKFDWKLAKVKLKKTHWFGWRLKKPSHNFDFHSMPNYAFSCDFHRNSISPNNSIWTTFSEWMNDLGMRACVNSFQFNIHHFTYKYI